MGKRRLDELDLAKGIGILLVVIAHSPYPSEPVRAYITAFHMPLFFIVSGMLLCHTGEEEKHFSVLLRAKARTICVPYVTFSAAYLLLDIAALYLKPGQLTWTDIERSCIEFATLYGISVLWFLVALFFGELLFLRWKKRCNRWKYGDLAMIGSGIIAAVILTAVSTPFRNDYPMYRSMPILWLGYYLTALLRSIGAFSFLVIGYYSYRYFFSRRKEARGFVWQEAACGVLCLLLVGAVSQVNGVVDLHFLVFGSPLLYYIGASAGTFGVILLCRQLAAVRWVSRPLRAMGVHSLIIMATHLDFRVLITAIHFANWMNQYVTRAKVYVLYLNVALMTALLEAALIFLIDRFLPFMTGRRSRRGLTLLKGTGKKR